MLRCHCNKLQRALRPSRVYSRAASIESARAECFAEPLVRALNAPEQGTRQFRRGSLAGANSLLAEVEDRFRNSDLLAAQQNASASNSQRPAIFQTRVTAEGTGLSKQDRYILREEMIFEFL